nr:hypothetical protein [Tanacetum cinerariifolium]
MCGRMFPQESDEVEKYVGGLPDMIQGNVMSARPKIMQEAIALANDLMDLKVRDCAERQVKNKRKFDNNNQAQQQLPKRQNVVQAYNVGSGEKKEYELALMCGRMFPEEFDEVEKYVGGLSDMIQGNVMSARPKIMQEAIELANDLMDLKVRDYAERQVKNKRKFDNNNQAQQQLPKRPNVVQAYNVRSGEKKEILLLLTIKETSLAMNKNQGHYKSDFPELRSRNHGNQAEDTKAHRVVYDVGGEEIDQDLNNNKYEIESQEEDFLASTSEP